MGGVERVGPEVLIKGYAAAWIETVPGYRWREGVAVPADRRHEVSCGGPKEEKLANVMGLRWVGR